MRYIEAAFECSDTCKRRAKRCNWECFSIHHDSAFPACNTRRHWISFSFQTLMCMQWNAASQTRKQTHRQEMCHKTQLCYKLHWISAHLWLCNDIFSSYYSVTPRLCHVTAAVEAAVCCRCALHWHMSYAITCPYISAHWLLCWALCHADPRKDLEIAPHKV